MQREFGRFETAPAVANEYACFNLVGILKIENAPSPEIVQKSLDILQAHHSALRTRIEKSKNSYYFRSTDEKIPLKVETRIDESQWISEVEHYLNIPINWAAGPLLNCTCLISSGMSEIIFAFHHSIADAISLVIFLDDFLKLCAAQQSDESITGYDGYPALPAVEDMFPPLFSGLRMNFRTLGFVIRQIAAEISIMRKTKGKRLPPVHTESVCKVLKMELSEQETTALLKNARRHEVTLNSIQHAAMLMAVNKHLYRQESIPLKYILFQNLRPYLEPPLTAEVLGSYVAMIQLVIDMSPERNFWEISREINQAVYKTGKSGDKYISANMSGILLKMLFRFKSFRMAATAMNYSGAISLQPSYGDINVVDVRGFVSNFGLGPEFSAQTLIFNGRLSWNVVYLETDMNQEKAQTIANEIRQILTNHRNNDNLTC